MTLQTVYCDSDVTITVAGTLTHLCPFVDETDLGTFTVSWRPDGRTFELHSLAAYLGAFTDARLSHESITDRIRHDLASTPGIAAVRVDTTWTTGALDVLVRSGDADEIRREPVNAES